MKITLKSITFVLIIVVALANNTLGCTTFCLKNKGEVLFGKNYDWMIGDGAVFVNRRGVSKWSGLESERNVAKWTSKYGSVTFNQYGWESPSGGMNEAGLVIELMWLDGTEYPAPDHRPAIDVLEWIQFNLDTAATTEEVIANSERVRIVSRVNLHYLVNDKSGRSAAIEFIGGRLVAHTGERMPVAALANDTYERSLNYARTTAAAPGESSLDRFARAAARSTEFASSAMTGKEAVDHAFGILAGVAQKNSTQWSIVYDQERGKIYFRTRMSPAIKMINMSVFDHSCSAPPKMLDMNLPIEGDVSRRFSDLTRRANRDLIERSFAGTDFLRAVPAAAKDALAAFPEQFTCDGKRPAIKPEPKQPAAAGAALTWVDAIFPLYYVYKTLASY